MTKSATVGDFVVFISCALPPRQGRADRTDLTQLTGPLNQVRALTSRVSDCADLAQLGTLYRVVQSNLTDTDNLVKLLNEQVEIADKPGALELLKCEGEIEFDNVSFSCSFARSLHVRSPSQTTARASRSRTSASRFQRARRSPLSARAGRASPPC